MLHDLAIDNGYVALTWHLGAEKDGDIERMSKT